MSNDRRSYWNDDYFKYWKARVDEANDHQADSSKLISGDALTTDDEVYFNAIKMLDLVASDHVLELGCGFGRSVPLIATKVSEVVAIDISEAMINEARNRCRNIANVKFLVSEAEKINLPDQIFSKIICFAVFDALSQADALKEINRLLQDGGLLLVTGKNDSYFADDQNAHIAEIRARSKGHPNFFTDVVFLKENLCKFGFAMKKERYFRRRGDTSLEKFTECLPSMFYEYAFILEKIGPVQADAPTSISSYYSKTFLNMHSETK